MESVISASLLEARLIVERTNERLTLHLSLELKKDEDTVSLIICRPHTIPLCPPSDVSLGNKPFIHRPVELMETQVQ